MSDLGSSQEEHVSEPDRVEETTSPAKGYHFSSKAIAEHWRDWNELTSALKMIAIGWLWSAGAALLLLLPIIIPSPIAPYLREQVGIEATIPEPPFALHTQVMLRAVFWVVSVALLAAIVFHVLGVLRSAIVPVWRFRCLLLVSTFAFTAAVLLVLTLESPRNSEPTFRSTVGFAAAAAFLFGLSRMLFYRVLANLAKNCQGIAPDQDTRLRSVEKIAKSALVCGLISVAISSIGFSMIGSAVDSYRPRELFSPLVVVTLIAATFTMVQEVCLPIACWKLSRGIFAIVKTAYEEELQPHEFIRTKPVCRADGAADKA